MPFTYWGAGDMGGGVTAWWQVVPRLTVLITLCTYKKRIMMVYT